MDQHLAAEMPSTPLPAPWNSIARGAPARTRATDAASATLSKAARALAASMSTVMMPTVVTPAPRRAARVCSPSLSEVRGATGSGSAGSQRQAGRSAKTGASIRSQTGTTRQPLDGFEPRVAPPAGLPADLEGRGKAPSLTRRRNVAREMPSRAAAGSSESKKRRSIRHRKLHSGRATRRAAERGSSRRDAMTMGMAIRRASVLGVSPAGDIPSRDFEAAFSASLRAAS